MSSLLQSLRRFFGGDPGDHGLGDPRAHEHSQGAVTHSHAQESPEHDHDGEPHSHPHTHEPGLEDDHTHDH